MKKLSLEEIHEVLLNIAKDFDRICTKHNIPYFMLGGTMLGAVRHKGFIPWDDDMDFGVPVAYYNQLEEILSKELSHQYRCSTYLNSKSVFVPFMKIEDTSTILDDKQINLPIKEKNGVNIDIFPLYYCGKDDKTYKTFKKARSYTIIAGKIFTDSRTSLLKNLLKKPLHWICPVDYKWFIRNSIKSLDTVEPGDYIANVFGRWGEREICPESWFQSGQRYEFEGTSFLGPLNFDAYLSQIYNDYKVLPPKESQFRHSENAYRKLG